MVGRRPGPAAGPGSTVAGARGREPTVGGRGREPGEPAVARDGATRGDTCHLDVVDRWGNMITATPSGGWLHSNPVVPELGFPLGTRLQMTWLEPGLPDTLTPGRRPRTTLTPSLALRDGRPVLAFGTPGGDQQDQWQLHFFLAAVLRPYVRGGLDLQGAIDAPNWHTESFPGSFYPRGMRPGSVTVESRMPGRPSSTGCGSAAMTWRVGPPGRRDGCAPWHATRRRRAERCGQPPRYAGLRGGTLRRTALTPCTAALHCRDPLPYCSN